MAQWIRPWTLNCEVPGSNLQAAAIVPLGKALCPHCLVPRKGLKAGCLLISSLLLSNQDKKSNYIQLTTHWILYLMDPIIIQISEVGI